MPNFSQLISEKRKALGLSQKEVATRVLKEDASAISPQYLNDLEHDRRGAPSDHLIKELARVLEIDEDVLFYAAGELSPDLRQIDRDEKTVGEAIRAFRRKLGSG